MQIRNSLKHLFIVFSLLVSGLYGVQAGAQTVVSDAVVTISPSAPASGQPIQAVVSGVSGSNCIEADAPTVSQDGSTITLTSVYSPTPTDPIIGCLAVLTPFSYTVNIAALPEGSYSVAWVLTDATPPTVLATASFSVTGPVSIPTLSEWSLLVLILMLSAISARQFYSPNKKN